MSHKILVAYKSNYGTTKQYASWIAEDLGTIPGATADLKERKDALSSHINDYDCVIFGGGIYAGGILGSDLLAKSSCKNPVLFTVGLADPSTTDYSKILSKNFSPEKLQSIKVFHLRGGIDYAKLNFIHRGMMALLKKLTIDKKKSEELTEEDRLFAKTYGSKIEFTDHAAIAPLIDYVKGLMTEADSK